MQIQHLEVANFRKLLSVRIDLSAETTLLVGANNSGKSSAMLALRKFFSGKASGFKLQDLTLAHFTKIEEIGQEWEVDGSDDALPNVNDWDDWLPHLDIWISAESGELHFIRDLIPNFEWRGGLVGMRFRLEPDDMAELYADYRKQRERVGLLEAALAADPKVAKAMLAAADESADQDDDVEEVPAKLSLWPQDLTDYLSRRMGRLFKIRAYRLDPAKLQTTCTSTRRALPQRLNPTALPLEKNPLEGLIKIHEINAQRGFGDHGDEGYEETVKGGKKLSDQLRAYYQKHLDPGDTPLVADLKALRAIEVAQSAFNTRLSDSFGPALKQVQTLGYPGRSDPMITLQAKLAATDGLNHEAAVLFQVDSFARQAGTPVLKLPETSNGLGYQNLIWMIFRLMSFRDDWLKRSRNPDVQTATGIEPIHLVLVEEPEAHLHVQVQQVFVKHAYEVLCRDELTKQYPNLKTQLVVSTHSSHVAHEVEYQHLRYFRRLPAGMDNIPVPVSTVSNLSNVFGDKTYTQEFVTRYLRAQHADLFFADAVILVEGAAERMLLPHFLRSKYEFLDQCYITILDIGGSHAHRLRPLIDALGILTLVITDLDAGKKRSAQPARLGAGLTTNNPTLRHWIRMKGESAQVDDLMIMPPEAKWQVIDDLFAIRIAYQTPIAVSLPEIGDVEVLANTFEDSLVLSNTEYFTNRAGRGLLGTFHKALRSAKTTDALNNDLFEALRNGDKAQFALQVLGDPAFKSLKLPEYISEGLAWLELNLMKKRSELLLVTAADEEAAS
ncbi:AAA family ATPase [Pseudomonas putida]|uniref:AAA family ATPase n=1 Tax=Pseudomonas putida TaxID=303 RepID=UPI0039DFCF50